jgi:putative hydrolase of the HAD superfamily
LPDHDIQAILFDFGGVLLQHSDGIDHRAIESRFALQEGTLHRILYRDSRYMEFQVGKCTWDEWLGSIRAAAEEHVGARASDVMRAFQEAANELNPDVMGLVRRLQGRYRTGIISNTIPGMEARIRQQFPEFLDLFEVRIGSGDLGVAKPDAEIYLHAARALDVPPEACVFTDDNRGFAEAAREVGMHGFHFTGYDRFAADLRSVGVAC